MKFLGLQQTPFLGVWFSSECVLAILKEAGSSSAKEQDADDEMNQEARPHGVALDAISGQVPDSSVSQRGHRALRSVSALPTGLHIRASSLPWLVGPWAALQQVAEDPGRSS